jgi:hypothetical protein
VLVPRSSGTPVATWAWPSWVVSQRRVLEAVFILLEFPSPSKRIFIVSHSLPPPLWFAVSVLHLFPRGAQGAGVEGVWPGSFGVATLGRVMVRSAAITVAGCWFLYFPL